MDYEKVVEKAKDWIASGKKTLKKDELERLRAIFDRFYLGNRAFVDKETYDKARKSAKAMGEFGAVSVVSGNVRGRTNTMPLQVEALYNDYDFTAAFGLASLLATLGLVSIGVKKWIEWRSKQGGSQ